MKVENLLIISAILIILYYLINKASETFTNSNNDKDCSQRAINDGHLTYVFGTPYFVRPG